MRQIGRRRKRQVRVRERRLRTEHETAVGIRRRGFRQDCVRDHPVRDGPYRAACRTFAIAEVAFPVVIKIARAICAAIVAPGLAGRAVCHIRRRDREPVRYLREARLVIVVHIDDGVRHEHLRLRYGPCEVGVPEKPVVARQCAQVVSPGVAVALRILESGIVLVDDRVAVRRVYVVVNGIGDLAGRDSASEVPDEAVVERGRLDGRVVRAGASAQERKLLVKEGRHLVVEAEQARGRRAIVYLGHPGGVAAPGGAKADRGVQRIRIGVVSEERVHVGKAFHGEKQLLVHLRVIDPLRGTGGDGHGFRLVEKRLV